MSDFNKLNTSFAIDSLKKKLIFTVTTGRSGTAFLASIFGFAKNIYVTHEPAPEFSLVLRRIQTKNNIARQFWLEKKLPSINQISTKIYFETSHLVCKGFLEPLVDLGIVPDLVIHRRAKREVALSMFKMGTIPGRSDKGLQFYLTPSDPDVVKLSHWQRLHDYQLCYWYCIEIEKRAQKYSKLFPTYGARVIETTLSGLKTFGGLKKSFTDLNLKMKKPIWLTMLRFKRINNVKVNQSMETKKRIEIPENLAELEEEVFYRIGKF